MMKFRVTSFTGVLLLLALSVGGSYFYSSARSSGWEPSARQTNSRTQKPPSVAERIKRVENGLLPPVLIKGQPVTAMYLADRMQFYKTPGLSVAVINNGRI